MAMQTAAAALNARHSSSALVCFSPAPLSQIFRHGFRGVPGHSHLFLEKLTLRLAGQTIQRSRTRKKRTHVLTAAALQVSQQVISPEEEIQAAQGNFKEPSLTLLETNEQLAPQLEGSPNEQSLPQLEASPSGVQGAPPLVEGLGAPAEQASPMSAIVSSPEAGTLNQSLDLESVRSNTEASMNAVIESSQEALNTAKDSKVSEQAKSAKELYEALLSGKGNPAESESLGDPDSLSISESIMEAKTAFDDAISKAQGSLHNSFDGARGAVKETYDNVNGSIVAFVKGLTGSSEKSTSTLGPVGSSETISNTEQSLLDTLTSPFRIGTPANNVLKGVVTGIEHLASTTLTAAGTVITKGYASTKEVLPVDVRLNLDGAEKGLAEFAGPIQSAFRKVYIVIIDAEKTVGIDPENPIIPVIVFVGGSFLLGGLYWQSRYGGYSGDLTPDSALELLKKEGNALLVDTRPEGSRESEGIPDLRRQIRSKIANVEATKLQGTLQKLLKNTSEAESAITATIIKNLKSVQSNTKVIIMDVDGSQSKTIARALKKTGIKMPYIIDGGFKAWKADGLRVKQLGPETTLSIIKEETEAILEEVNPTPSGLIAVTLGAFAGVYALLEWEKTLQLLGLVCIGQVLYTRINSYDSAEDVKNDLRILLRPVELATQAIAWVSGQPEPSKLQLATAPSTSAVQDRVLQAAAKHGPLASEMEAEEQVEAGNYKEEAAAKEADGLNVPE